MNLNFPVHGASFLLSLAQHGSALKSRPAGPVRTMARFGQSAPVPVGPADALGPVNLMGEVPAAPGQPANNGCGNDQEDQ